jgi:pimeloyl-ACP methyl ester carboxylesterase
MGRAYGSMWTGPRLCPRATRCGCGRPRSSCCTARVTQDMRPDLIVQSGFARWDTPRLVEGFRRFAGDEVAEIAGRGYTGEEVPDDEWARVAAAFGRCVPDKEQRARTPRISSSTRMAWSSSADSTSSISSAESTLRRSSWSVSSIRSHRSPPPRRSSESCGRGAAQLEIIEGAGHFTWMDAPDRFWPTIIEFIHSTAACERVAAAS